VSVGTVYFYFKNKQDLLVKLVEEIGYRLRTMIGKEFKKSGSTMEGFKKAGTIFFEDFCVKYPEKAAIMYRESVGQGDEVEACRKRITELLREDVRNALVLVSRNLGRQFKSGLSAEVISVIIMGIYERIAYQYLLWQKRSEDLQAIGRDAIGFIEGGINNLLDASPCT
jgi:AcrR family transcriptional regulator